MPALHIVLRWPDGTTATYYSPSTIVRNYFEPGRAYPLADFTARARAALTAASERVRQVHGMPCSLAASSLAAIEARAAAHSDGHVTMEKFEQDGRR
jgi:uncharacterized repeat protein (TIGR04042 family)